MSRTLAAALVAVLTSACAGTVRHVASATATIPDAWSAPVAEKDLDRDALAAWWTTFNDAILERIVDQAINGNLDIRTAMSRVRQARAQLAAARTGRMPTVNATSGVSVSRATVQVGDSTAVAQVQRNYDLGLEAGWEPDAWGRVASASESASQTVQADIGDLQDVLLTTVADAAVDYIRIRELQERLRVAGTNRDTQRETLDIANYRYQAGLTTELDVDQARANVESTEAQIASLRSQLSQAQHALAILLGVPPASLDEELRDATAIPEAPLSAAVGVPADTIRRRPDVRAAEHRLAAQGAQTDATRAQLYPQMSLSGSIGVETLKIASLFSPASLFWRALPAMSWRVFDRTQIRANLTAQGELETQAGIQYEAQVLGALRDVEDSLVAYAEEQERRSHLAEAVAASQAAADLSLRLYNTGLRDFRDVLDAQRMLLSLQDQLASSRSTVSQYLVRLYRSVGGGWAAVSAVTTTP